MPSLHKSVVFKYIYMQPTYVCVTSIRGLRFTRLTFPGQEGKKIIGWLYNKEGVKVFFTEND